MSAPTEQRTVVFSEGRRRQVQLVLGILEVAVDDSARIAVEQLDELTERLGIENSLGRRASGLLHRRGLPACRPAEPTTERGRQAVALHWLRDVVVHAGLQTTFAIALHCVCCHCDDG